MHFKCHNLRCLGLIHGLFLAATAALEVQMLVCLCVCHTCYKGTKALNFQFFRLKDFDRTSGGLLKDFGFYGLQNLLVYKSQPQVFKTCYDFLCLQKLNPTKM